MSSKSACLIPYFLLSTLVSITCRDLAYANSFVGTICLDSQSIPKTATLDSHDFELAITEITPGYYRGEGKHFKPNGSSPTPVFGSGFLTQDGRLVMTLIESLTSSKLTYLLTMTPAETVLLAGNYKVISTSKDLSSPIIEVGTIHLAACDQDRISSDTIDHDGDGVTGTAGDCNDAEPTIFPTAEDICGDGIDQNCDGIDPVCDLDHDGSPAGIDCNDNDPTVYPGAPDNPFDNVDSDCDPTTYPTN